MASPDLLSKILEAYYEAEFADPPEQASKTAALEALIDQAIAGTAYSRRGFVELMASRYKNHRRARKKREGIPPRLIDGEPPPVSN